MKRQKRYFNMVEVALALLVISLGLSTVLTLFPAGLKATTQAENDNNVVEAAECIYAYLQALVKSSGTIRVRSNAYTGTPAAASNENRITEDTSNKVYVYRKTTKSAANKYIEDFSCVAQVYVSNDTTSSGTPARLYLPKMLNSGGSSSSAVAELNDDFADPQKYHFDSFAPDPNGVVSVPGGGPNLCRTFCVELSYPATAGYEQREKKTFHMVFLE